jgi:TPP-dependent trihydroxycyclohexane-1,2-dione (THcHDO) dehydratase
LKRRARDVLAMSQLVEAIEELRVALQMAQKQTCPVLIEVETLFRI